MKKLLWCGLILIVTLSSCVSGYPIWRKPYEERIRRVYTIHSMEKDEIFLRAHLWVVDTIYPTEGQVLLEDEERGLIRGSGVQYVGTVTHGERLHRREYRFHITIRCMDELLEVVFSNVVPKTFSHSSNTSPLDPGRVPYKKAVFNAIKLDLYALAEDCYRSICEETQSGD